MSYATLQTRFLAWVKRTDITALFPDFVALAEAKFNREIRVSQMEDVFSGTIDANGEIAKPAGFLAPSNLWPSSNPQAVLTAQALATVVANPRYGVYPTNFAVKSSSLYFNGAGDIAGVYYKTIPGLQANLTNWLDTQSPDLYLNATLAEAYTYLEDPKAAIFVTERDRLIAEVISNDMRDRFSGQLQAMKR